MPNKANALANMDSDSETKIAAMPPINVNGRFAMTTIAERVDLKAMLNSSNITTATPVPIK